MERYERIKRYSPLLAELVDGLYTLYSAERLILNVIRLTQEKRVPAEIRTDPIVIEIQAAYRQERKAGT
jgi:hypothetical protein